MDFFENVQNLIESHRQFVNFGTFGDGVSKEWIKKAEDALGISLPPTYRWWMANYRGGEIAGEEIYTIYEEEFDTVAGGDIVAMHRLDVADGLRQPHEIAVCHSDVDGVFFFNTLAQRTDGEYPIISAVTGHSYANDFLEFVIKRIRAVTN